MSFHPLPAASEKPRAAQAFYAPIFGLVYRSRPEDGGSSQDLLHLVRSRGARFWKEVLNICQAFHSPLKQSYSSVDMGTEILWKF